MRLKLGYIKRERTDTGGTERRPPSNDWCRRSNRIGNERIGKLLCACKLVGEIINENTMRLYGHTKRMNENRVMKRVFGNKLNWCEKITL